MDTGIRKGNPNDAENIAKVHIESWKTTYKGIIDAQYLDDLSLEDKIVKWENILQDKDIVVYVAEKNNTIIGFIALEKLKKEIHGHDGLISSLYILEQYQRMNIGNRLFKEAMEYLKILQCKKILVWVLKENPSKHFYEKMGGVFLIEEEMKIGINKYIECAYSWRI
ncbi:MAG: GNAT family N-acetyltransferase [Candidatus Altimarinota bacterium]